MVEKEICCKESGIYAAFMRNPALQAPARGECELVYIEDGIMTLRCGDASYNLRGGSSYLLYGTAGTLVTVCAGRAAVLRFPESIAEGIFGDRILARPLLEGQGEEAAELIRFVANELEEKKYGYALAAESAIKCALLEFCRGQELCPAASSRDADDDFFGGLLAEIDKKYADYTFDAAARFMRLSRAYFSVVFHKHMGTTFSQYLNYVKVRSAVNMLKRDDKASITDVSVRCGFGTIRNFNRAFRGITGYAPSAMPKDYELSPLC